MAHYEMTQTSSMMMTCEAHQIPRCVFPTSNDPVCVVGPDTKMAPQGYHGDNRHAAEHVLQRRQCAQ